MILPMKIQAQIDVEELVVLRQALFSLEITLHHLNSLDKSNEIIFQSDKEILQKAKKALDCIVKSE